MKTYRIILIDKVTKKIEFVENLKTDSIEELSNRLLELQAGYCEDEKPTVEQQIFNSGKHKINTLIASSGSDFSYAAPLHIVS